MTREAAALVLGTSPAVLTLWEQRFGYPVARRAADGRVTYPDYMVIALRDALTREASIAAAISQARKPRSYRRHRREAFLGPRSRFVVSLDCRRRAR
jgi:hypothetical protein